ncbi:MAG: flagellar export chaperone FlgN [Candidatus Nitrospinota bacterium M3_3B_026]
MKTDKDIKNLASELADTLALNVDLYGGMEKALEAERAAIKNHSLDDLDAAVRSKTGVAARIKALDSARLGLLRRISEKTGTPEDELTIAGISDFLAGETRARLLDLRVLLRGKVESVTKMNEFNRGLLERLMRLNYQAALKLQELAAPESTYARNGASNGKLKPGRVVNRKF